MADGTPALERVVSQEDTLLSLLQDTDKRLSELERQVYQLALEGEGEITVLTIDQLIPYPEQGLVAYVVETDSYYVPGVVGSGIGPNNNWIPQP